MGTLPLKGVNPNWFSSDSYWGKRA
jgi:simple sugar transport system permease protein/ribose transport system permease protein